MTDQKIIDLFDSSNITLRELAAMSGRSVAELKALLMGAYVFPENGSESPIKTLLMGA